MNYWTSRYIVLNCTQLQVNSPEIFEDVDKRANLKQNFSKMGKQVNDPLDKR